MDEATKVFVIAAQVLPMVNTIVNVVENYPNLTGAQKKEAALGFMKSVWVGLQDPNIAKIKEIKGIPFEAIAPLLSMFIDSIVSLFNAIGVFSKD